MDIDTIITASQRRRLHREALDAFHTVLEADAQIAAYAVRQGGIELASMQGQLVPVEAWATAIGAGEAFSPRNTLLLSPKPIPQKLVSAATEARRIFTSLGGQGIRANGPWMLARDARTPLGRSPWPQRHPDQIVYSSGAAWRGGTQTYQTFSTWLDADAGQAALALDTETDPRTRQSIENRLNRLRRALDTLQQLHDAHGGQIVARWPSGAAVKLRALWGRQTSPNVAIGGLLVIPGSAATTITRAPQRRRPTRWPTFLTSILGWSIYTQ